jgi:hypothetical protein
MPGRLPSRVGSTPERPTEQNIVWSYLNPRAHSEGQSLVRTEHWFLRLIRRSNGEVIKKLADNASEFEDPPCPRAAQKEST